MLKKNRMNKGYHDRMTRNLARARVAPVTPSDWVVREYIGNREVDTWAIENRSEIEATHEAEAGVPDDHDWTLTVSD